MLNVNKPGRFYSSGKALCPDLRQPIIDRCLRYGGHQLNGYIPIEFKVVGKELGVTGNTVAKIWRYYCFKDRRTTPLAKGGDYCSKLSHGDLELIEML